MEKKEVSLLLEQLTFYRRYYVDSLDEDEWERLKQDWLGVLEEYDYEDVKKNLDEFFSKESNQNKVPNPYLLKEGLYKTEQKFKPGKWYCYCNNCRRIFEHYSRHEEEPLSPFEKHVKRCNSIYYLKRLYNQYFNREIPEVEIGNMYKMAEDRFNGVYYQVCEKVYKQMPEGSSEYTFMKAMLDTRYEIKKELGAKNVEDS